jgi:predicted small metal-binding protein
MMIDDERLHQALSLLTSTDEQCAALRADMERTEQKAKATRAAMVKCADGSSASAREANADSSAEVAAAWEDHFKAMHKYHALANRRTSEAIIIDTWRSLNASRRIGNV